MEHFETLLLNGLRNSQWVADVLRDPVVDSTKVVEWRRWYESTSSRHHPAERGLLGLKLFTIDADNDQPDKEAVDRVLLADPDTKKALFAQYNIAASDIVTKPLLFQKAGSTSFIIRAGDRALKLIKPRYWGIQSIAKATQEYGGIYGGIGTFAPRIQVGHSNERWISMEFIDAPTLTEFLRLDYFQTADEADRFAIVETVMIGICSAMKSCLAQYRHHLDLSPDNILVEHRGGKVSKTWIVDFGVNYLLVEGIGIPRGKSAVFFAPELRRRTAGGNELTDVYSLGMIMLASLVGEELTAATYMDRLDKLWEEQPEFAELIEDMIDPQTEEVAGPQKINRLMLLQYHGNVFEALEKRIVQLIKLHRDRLTIPHPIQQLADILHNIVPIETLLHLFNEWDRSRNRPSRRLFRWLWWAHFAEFIAIGSFVAFVVWPFGSLYKWRACTLFHNCLLDEKTPTLPSVFNGILEGHINGFFFGRLVAFSFSLVLTAFYANIFSTVQTKHLLAGGQRRLPLIVDYIMRVFPLFGAGPILYTIIVDPKAWPFCSALGLATVGINNWFSYRLMKMSVQSMTDKLRFPFTKSVNDQMEHFSTWWWMIALYCGSLVVVGVLLVNGIAKDEWLYASFVAIVVNYLKMQADNCGKLAPGVRGLFRRLSSGLARADAATRAESARQISAASVGR